MARSESALAGQIGAQIEMIFRAFCNQRLAFAQLEPRGIDLHGHIDSFQLIASVIKVAYLSVCLPARPSCCWSSSSQWQSSACDGHFGAAGKKSLGALCARRLARRRRPPPPLLMADH